MLRLVAYAPDGVRRFPVNRREIVIGSEPSCDISLPYPGISSQHARFRFDGDNLSVEDLGSRRGVLVGGQRVREHELGILDEIKIGTVTLLVEDVVPEASSEVEAPEAVSGVAGTDRGGRDERSKMTAGGMLEQIARISNWVLADTESRTTLESIVQVLLSDFGGGALFLFVGEIDSAGIKFVTASDPDWLGDGEGLLEQVQERLSQGQGGDDGLFFEGALGGDPAWIFHRSFSALERPYFMVCALGNFDPQEWSPVPAFFALGDLLSLGLVHHVGRYEPILPGHRANQELTLDPQIVVGESPVMQALVERLRAAVDSNVRVILLSGGAGVGKQLIARSLHHSSKRRQGPFIETTCDGANAAMVEADLFGAEIPGRDTPVRREGKLLLADGGTLFLDDVDKLPLDLQARLVRFLRSGEVEAAGSTSAHRVDVHLVVSSRGPLEPAVARDEFRVDLAYQLSQFAIEVPSLHNRREDLPLLIQAYVNRFCHETGKRIQGITVKAMTALTEYDFPGNLSELENVARQMVYLCPHGEPVDLNHLPEAVKQSPIRSASRIGPTSDLALDRLVGDCERSAILEALKRTRGNKSKAARLLGVSRNGLAMKIDRHGIST